jgi:succinate dehydrogenase / fumarate reductase cytochrome b subunit
MTYTFALIQTSIGKKTISAGTGFLLGVFLFVHMLGNAATLFGRGAYNAYAAHLHALGPFLKVPESCLALTLLVHVLTGLLLFIENRKARPSRYAGSAPLPGKVNAATMPYTGAVILVFIASHLFHFHFAHIPSTLADLVRTTLSQPVIGGCYLAAFCALALHLSHGFWSLLQTFGINHPRFNGFFLLSGRTGGGLISGIFSLIVTLCLCSASFLR